MEIVCGTKRGLSGVGIVLGVRWRTSWCRCWFLRLETWFDFVIMRGRRRYALTYLLIRKGKEILSTKGK